jgi:hypothetical protein
VLVTCRHFAVNCEKNVITSVHDGRMLKQQREIFFLTFSENQRCDFYDYEKNKV